MTLPKLLFALGQKCVVLSEGKRGRIRFNPRDPVSPAMKAGIQEHKPAILALLRGEDLDEWRMVRLRKLEDGPLEHGGVLDFDTDSYVEPDSALLEKWGLEDMEEAARDWYS